MSLGSPRRRAVASALATALLATLTPAAPATATATTTAETATGLSSAGQTAARPFSAQQATGGTVKVPRIDPDVKNAQLRLVVTATGSDDYRATLAWAELDPAFSGKKVLLAVTQDSAKLDREGPRLVVPGDVKGGRYVSGVVRLHVGDTDALDPS